MVHVSDRVFARTTGVGTSGQAGWHVGDAIVATHWIPVPARARAAQVTVRVQVWLRGRHDFLSVWDDKAENHQLYNNWKIFH